jgi:hypothetical protein
MILMQRSWGVLGGHFRNLLFRDEMSIRHESLAVSSTTNPPKSVQATHMVQRVMTLHQCECSIVNTENGLETQHVAHAPRPADIRVAFGNRLVFRQQPSHLALPPTPPLRGVQANLVVRVGQKGIVSLTERLEIPSIFRFDRSGKLLPAC